ncbi:ABC-type maltose transport system permease subunit [Granulicella mallensis]|uniref:ABC-type maltose transport system permease subunit n=1 Tax=Granulicella mallensis TaxID=940614 RepID=A0A7W7ZTU4_9BACT|nr:ABC-type maltose transport system permease subunit [Granulicella mallensis]
MAVVDTLEVVADMLVAAEAVTPAVVDIAKARRLDQTTSGEAYSFAARCLMTSIPQVVYCAAQRYSPSTYLRARRKNSS